MSGRGARSRKAIAKDIEKKEKKSSIKQQSVESIRRPHDAFDSWSVTSPTGTNRNASLPSRTITISSDASRATSRSSSTQASRDKPRLHRIDSNESTNFGIFHRPKTSASRRTSISEDSFTGKEKKKYQAKGKQTAAPRGRGGGVPIKKPVSESPLPPLIRAESTTRQLLSPNTKTWINFRIWDGGESGLRPYGGWDYDEHMQTGNVLIYFKEETSEDRPMPQIRCDFEVLQNSGSTWLKNALLYGHIDENEDEWSIPGSPQSSAASPRQQPMQIVSPNFRHAPPSQMVDDAYYGVPGSRSYTPNQYYPPPPGSTFGPPDDRPTHELWFTAPQHIRTPQGQRLHHVAVRNFLAMLHNKPIVGADLYEMLSTLQPEIQVMYDLDHDDRSRMTPREQSVQMITQYLVTHGLDDIRNSITLSLGLLAWSEQDNIRWRQGYLESFVHLAGVMSPQLEDSPHFKRLSMGTRRNLGIAAKTLQLQVIEAEEKLAAFDFADLWEETAKTSSNPVYQSYLGFRQFLVNHYTQVYGAWPPNHGKNWLSRKLVLELQEDFGSLYDYLVDRDVIWDPREERPGKKWTMEHRTKPSDFRADFPELNLTDMLVTFDSRHGFLHIPHPYPLLPREVPAVKAPTKKSFFSSLKKTKTDSTKDAKAHLQLSIVFSDATNIERLDASFRGSTLIDQFEQFELSADLKGIRPRDARLGRWVLLYGVLQVLSRLSVDVQGLKWTDGVRYFLCADVKRCPEWVTTRQADSFEASQLRSYCWQRSWSDKKMTPAPVELDGSSIPAPPAPLPPSVNMDGATMLNHDIQRISEKIENLGRARAYERRVENEKLKHEDMIRAKRDEGYRLTESDFHSPMVPTRSPLRSAVTPQPYGSHPAHYQHGRNEWGSNQI